jgi:hypothetical protein
MINTTTQMREFNRLKEVFQQEKYRNIDRHLYEVESSRIEKKLTVMSKATFRKLVEFLAEESVMDVAVRIKRKKNNIIVNAGLLKILIDDKHDSLVALRKAVEVLSAYKYTRTDINLSLALDIIGRWWKVVPDSIRKYNNRQRGWYFFDIDDLIELLNNHWKVEKVAHENLILLEMEIEEYCKNKILTDKGKKERAARREAAKVVKEHRKQALEKARERRTKDVRLDKV